MILLLANRIYYPWYKRIYYNRFGCDKLSTFWGTIYQNLFIYKACKTIFIWKYIDIRKLHDVNVINGVFTGQEEIYTLIKRFRINNLNTLRVEMFSVGLLLTWNKAVTVHIKLSPWNGIKGNLWYFHFPLRLCLVVLT